jgi:hypothetical protein
VNHDLLDSLEAVLGSTAGEPYTGVVFDAISAFDSDLNVLLTGFGLARCSAHDFHRVHAKWQVVAAFLSSFIFVSKIVGHVIFLP